MRIWIVLSLTLVSASYIASLRKSCYYTISDESMHCENVYLGTLQRGVYPINITSVKKMNLASTQLQQLDSYSFFYLKNLVVLHLENNKLQNLSHDLFTNQRHLKYLFLAYNELQCIDNRVFQNLYQLIHLDISYNNLMMFGDNRTFISQGELVYLKASYNRLTFINHEALKPLRSLKTLYLDSNPLDCVCDLNNAFLWTQKKCLNTLATCSTPLKYRDKPWSILQNEMCSDVSVEKNECSYTCIYIELTSIMDCSNINIKYFSPSRYPFNVTNFRKLWLNNNRLKVLHSNSFTLLTQLWYLSLRQNRIQVLEPQVFSTLKELRYLHLSNNELVYLDEQLFVSQKKLQVLNLRQNQLVIMPVQLLGPLVSLKRLLLEENQLNCDCMLKVTYQWSVKNNIYASASCHHPATYRGKSWSIVMNVELCKNYGNSNTLVVLSVLVSILVIFVLCGFTWSWYFWKKWKHKGVLLPVVRYKYSGTQEDEEGSVENLGHCNVIIAQHTGSTSD